MASNHGFDFIRCSSDKQSWMDVSPDAISKSPAKNWIAHLERVLYRKGFGEGALAVDLEWVR